MSIEEIIARRREQQALDAGSPPPTPASLPAPEFEADPEEQPEQSGVERIIAQRRAREQSTAFSIHRAMGVEPEARKKALILAEEFGAPLYLVEGDLPKFEQRYKEKRARQIAQRMPALAAEMNDPSAPAVLAEADLLADLDERLKPPEIDMPLLERFPEGMRRQARSIRQSSLKYLIEFGRATDEQRAEYDYLRANPPTPLKNQPGPWNEIMEGTGGILPYVFDVGVASVEGGAVGLAAGAAIGGATGGLPGAAALGREGMATGAKAAAMYRIMQIEAGGIGVQLDDIVDEIKRETGLDVPKSAIQGMMGVGGLVNAHVEGWALKKFAPMFPGGKFLLAKLARPQIKAMLLDVTKRSMLARVGTKMAQAAEAIGTNAIQEGIQGVAPRIAARVLTRAYLDPNAPLWTDDDWRGVWSDAAMGAAGGIGMSALGAGSSAITRVVTQPFVDRANLDRLDHMVDKANESKLAAENPDVFRRIVGRANDGKDGDRAIFVAPDVLASVLGPERLAELPELEDGIREATATRGEVVIRLEDYVTDLREFHQALSKNIRVGLAGATQQEIGFAERVQAELAKADEGRDDLTKAEESKRKIYDWAFEKAIAKAEMSIEEARHGAEQFSAYMAQLAAEVNEDPWEFFDRNVGPKLRIEGPGRQPEVTSPSLATRLDRADMESTLETLRHGQRSLKFPSYPVLDILKRNGGVDPNSTLAEELRHKGVTAQSHPGLYRKGGLESLDDFDAASEPVLLGHVQIPEGDYRADPNDLLDAIDKELRGTPLRSEEQLEALEAVEGPARELGRHLDELGIDPNTVTVEQVLELMQRQGVHRPEAGETNLEDEFYEDVTTFEQRRVSQKLIADALRVFGTTDAPSAAGYVMPGGEMLDFSGAPGQGRTLRAMDHRQLGELPGLKEATSHSAPMREFMVRAGAVRVDFVAGLAEAAGPITMDAARTIATWLHGNPEAHLELTNRDGERIRSLQVSDASPRAVHSFFAGESETFYQSGKPPSANALAVKGIRPVLSLLSEAEQQGMDARLAQNLVDLWKEPADVAERAERTKRAEGKEKPAIADFASEAATMAWKARSRRGWYARSARTLAAMFGEDAPRFTALLASLSPQIPVERNLEAALRVWAWWTGEMDRKATPEQIQALFAQKRIDEDGEEKTLFGTIPSATPGAILALTAADPMQITFKGLKVDSFYWNLMGEVDRVTLDTHMAAFFGWGIDFGRRSDYLAASAIIRKAAKILSERTGETWTPREIQETIWSWIFLAKEKAKRTDPKTKKRPTLLGIAKGEGITEAEFAAVPDFDELLFSAKYQQMMEGLGLGAEIESLRRSDRGAERTEAVRETTFEQEDPGIARDAELRHMARIGARSHRYVTLALAKTRAEKAAKAAREAERVASTAARDEVAQLTEFYQDSLAYMKALHGTGREFDRFLNRFIGSGEGTANQGYGHYFSSAEKAMRFYAAQEAQKGPRQLDLDEVDISVPKAAVAALKEAIALFRANAGGSTEHLATPPEAVAWLSGYLEDKIAQLHDDDLAADDLAAYREALGALESEMVTVSFEQQADPGDATHFTVSMPKGLSQAAQNWIWGQVEFLQDWALPNHEVEYTEAAIRATMLEKLADERDNLDDAADAPAVDAALEALRSGAVTLHLRRHGGRGIGLEVGIPLPDQLLDWRKAVSEQSEPVRKALEAIAALHPVAYHVIEVERATLQSLETVFATADEAYAYQAAHMRPGWNLIVERSGVDLGEDGQMVYRDLARTLGGAHWEGESYGNEQAASELLNSYGIRGHIYESDSGNENYVIYDGDSVQILRRLFQEATGEEREELLVLRSAIGNAVLRGDEKQAESLRERASEVLGGMLEQKPRGSFSFDPEFQELLIKMSHARDASTFLHESAHLYLELMLRTAERPDASQRLKDNAAAALSWMGAGSRLEVTREMHEKFASGYEAYLWEGKAPSLALRDSFARFTTWLLRIYPALTHLRVTLNDDIRGVFDRMLASDEAIAEARRVQGFMPAFKDAQTAGMTEEEFAAYELAAQRTYDEARRKLMRETLKDLERRKQAEYLEERERITQQVTLDVNSRPVFRARGWLSSGKVPEGTVGPELEHRKLDRDKLVRLKGKGILKVFRPGKFSIWQKEDGHDPEMIARVFGFDSADRMLNAFATTASRQEVIALEVQERLARRFGDVFRDGRLPEMAIEASMTNDQGEFLVAELRALRRQVQTKGEREQGRELPLRVIKRAARRQIEGRKVRDLREDIYRAAEQRAAMRAAEAILARDFQTAADEKRAEILNHYLAIEARDAREQAEKDRAYLLRMGGKAARSKLGKAGHDYLQQVDALLFRFKFGPMTKAASEEREALADWIIAQEKAGAVLQIDSKLRNEAFTVDWKGMTVEELSNLADAVRSIEHQAQHKNTLILKKQRRDFAEMREQAVASIGQNTVRDVRHLDPRDSTVDAIQSFARKAHGLHTKLEALFKRLDGGKLGFMWELCFKPFADAEAAEQEWLGELSGTLEGIFKKLRKAEGSWRGKVFVPEINRSLSYEKMIVIALNQGNEYNKSALLEGEGWNQQQVDAVLELLTEADWTAVREIAALVESLKERSFALHERLSGVRPEAVEPSEVVTRFGVYPGWYWPLKADPLRSQLALKREEAQSAQDMFQGNAFKPMTRQGHLIERTNFGGQPVMLSLSVLSEHLFNVVHDVTHREALIQVDRITQDAAVAGAIKDAVGLEMYLQIRPWLKGIAGERLAPVAVLEPALGYIRQGVSISYMGLKASVLLSQSLAVFQAMGPEGVGPVRFVRELQTFLTSPLEAQRRVKMALALSPALRARLTNFDRDARDAVKRGIFATSRLGEAHADFVQFAMGAIGLADMVVTVPTWLAAYGRALEEGATVERAVAEADSTIRLTMGAGGAKDLAAIQRGGELQRTLTGFYSAMSAIYNQFGLTIAAIRDGRMSLPEVALAAMFMWILPALAQPLLARRGPDDDESIWQWAFTEIMFFPASLAIGAREVAGGAERVVRGEYSDLSLPALDALETSVNATIGVTVDLAANGELSRKNAKDIVNAIGVWGHLPSRQAWITAEALYDLAYDQGEVDVMKGDLVLSRPPERRAQ